jgi:hypothetical protein
MNAIAVGYFRDRYSRPSRLMISPRLMPTASLLVVIKTETAPALSVKDMVTYLRGGGLPIAAIAEIVKVERKTVYSWLDGVEAREAHATRVETLFGLLAKNKIDLRSLYRVWNRTLEHGSSIRQMLTADFLSEPAIKDALNILGPALAKHSERDAVRRAPRDGARNPVIDDMPEAGLAE